MSAKPLMTATMRQDRHSGRERDGASTVRTDHPRERDRDGGWPMTTFGKLTTLTAYLSLAFVGAIVLGLL